MTSPRIVVFSCQWAPHYAWQSLDRRGRRGEGDGVRVLTACVGASVKTWFSRLSARALTA
jgi:hypothetical protein